jgi:hypothetical protein
MNDPGLDKPISEDAKDVENQKKDEHDAEEEDEQAFLEPKYDPRSGRKNMWLAGVTSVTWAGDCQYWTRYQASLLT